jgi:hypothetical protein
MLRSLQQCYQLGLTLKIVGDILNVYDLGFDTEKGAMATQGSTREAGGEGDAGNCAAAPMLPPEEKAAAPPANDAGVAVTASAADGRREQPVSTVPRPSAIGSVSVGRRAKTWHSVSGVLQFYTGAVFFTVGAALYCAFQSADLFLAGNIVWAIGAWRRRLGDT